MSQEEEKSVSETLKEQLTLLSALVILIGIVSTESYYASYGFRYQFLDIPAPHILYRGLTATILSPHILGLYALAASWLCFSDSLAQRYSIFAKVPKLMFSYLLVLGLVVGGYFFGISSGKVQAMKDMHSETTSLPRILSYASPDTRPECHNAAPLNGYRILLNNSDKVVLLNPLPKGVAPESIPAILIVSGDCFDVLTISR